MVHVIHYGLLDSFLFQGVFRAWFKTRQTESDIGIIFYFYQYAVLFLKFNNSLDVVSALHWKESIFHEKEASLVAKKNI